MNDEQMQVSKKKKKQRKQSQLDQKKFPHPCYNGNNYFNIVNSKHRKMRKEKR